MGINARQRAQEFSWTAYRQRGVEALRSFMKSPSNSIISEAIVSPM